MVSHSLLLSLSIVYFPKSYVASLLFLWMCIGPSLPSSVNISTKTSSYCRHRTSWMHPNNSLQIRHIEDRSGTTPSCRENFSERWTQIFKIRDWNELNTDDSTSSSTADVFQLGWPVTVSTTGYRDRQRLFILQLFKAAGHSSEFNRTTESLKYIKNNNSTVKAHLQLSSAIVGGRRHTAIHGLMNNEEKSEVSSHWQEIASRLD